MSTRGSRAIQARKRMGLSQYIAAKLLKVSPGTLSKFERDAIKTEDLILKMAQIYNTSPNWIEYGNNPSGISIKRNGQETFIEDLPDLPTFGYYAPLFEWNNLKNINLSYKQLKEQNHKEWVPVTSIGGRKSFAFRVEGYSMANTDFKGISFQPGDIVFFDKELTPYDGCFVACVIENESHAIFRQYIKDCGSYWLMPLNKKFPAIKIDKKLNYKILGVFFYRGTESMPPERAEYLDKKKNKKS